MRAEEVVIYGCVFYVVERRGRFYGYNCGDVVGSVIPAGTKPAVIRDTFDACRDALRIRVRMEQMIHKGLSENQAAMQIIFGR